MVDNRNDSDGNVVMIALVVAFKIMEALLMMMVVVCCL